MRCRIKDEDKIKMLNNNNKINVKFNMLELLTSLYPVLVDFTISLFVDNPGAQ